MVWARQTCRQAIEIVDEEREVFYGGLLRDLLREYDEVMGEYFNLIG